MSNNENEFGQRLQDLFSQAVKDQVRMTQNYVEFAQRIGRGDLFTESGRSDLFRFASQETANYVRDAASLSLTYYGELFKLNRTYSERFFSQFMDKPSNHADDKEMVGTDVEEPQTAVGAAVRRIEVPMQAPIGQTAVRTFTLENKQQEPAEISFLISDFVGSDEAVSFRSALTIEPARFVLPPGKAQTVTISLPLTADHFTPGKPYRAIVEVRGYDGLELELIGLAEPVADTVNEPSATKKSTRRRKRTGDKADAD
ncbi:hypothetical protein KFU94_44860 [Chloroflexi bacterium TSY]|nr:hypothetical protein [Chloroflexi bacterium TSY]